MPNWVSAYRAAEYGWGEQLAGKNGAFYAGCVSDTTLQLESNNEQII